MAGAIGGISNMFSGINFSDFAPLAQGIASGMGQQNAADARAQAYEQNAAIMNANAQQAMNAAEFEANRKRAQARRQLASNTTGYLKAGVQLEGSPTAALQEQASEGELDALTSLYTGQVQAAQYNNQANMQRYYARQERDAGDTMFRSSLISGAMKSYNKYSNKQNYSFGG